MKVFPSDCFETFLWKEMSQNKQKIRSKPREEKRWRFPILLSLAFGFHYVPAPGACRPVREPTVIWFIEIIWQGNKA